MAMQHWDLFRVGITRRLCRCDEIECGRCTQPYRPPQQRTRRELIEDVLDAANHAEELREKLQQNERVLALLAERMGLIRDVADPHCKVEVTVNEKKGDESCPSQ